MTQKTNCTTMVFKKCCITTRTKQWKSEPFLDRRRVRIFCFLRKAKCRGCAAMKAPVGLLSGRAVLRKQDGGALPRQAPARFQPLCVRQLHRGRGYVRCDHGAEVGVGLSHLQWPAWLCGLDSERWPGEIFEEYGWKPWTRNLNECWILLFFNWWCPAFFSVARSILMESLYFYNFLYGSFIYSMLIFMHTDR